MCCRICINILSAASLIFSGRYSIYIISDNIRFSDIQCFDVCENVKGICSYGMCSFLADKRKGLHIFYTGASERISLLSRRRFLYTDSAFKTFTESVHSADVLVPVDLNVSPTMDSMYVFKGTLSLKCPKSPNFLILYLSSQLNFKTSTAGLSSTWQGELMRFTDWKVGQAPLLSTANPDHCRHPVIQTDLLLLTMIRTRCC